MSKPSESPGSDLGAPWCKAFTPVDFLVQENAADESCEDRCFLFWMYAAVLKDRLQALVRYHGGMFSSADVTECVLQGA